MSKEINAHEEKLKNIYEMILIAKKNNEITPSVRELQEASGIKSTSTVYRMLKELQEMRLINLIPGKRRSITLVANE